MTIAAGLSVAERLVQVLHHLDIERAHFAASIPADIIGFVQAYPERMASLTLVCPPRLDPSPLRALGSRLQIIVGDQGPPAAMVRQAAKSLPDATLIWLQEYFSPPWADAVADRAHDIDTAFLDFLCDPLTNRPGPVRRPTPKAPSQALPTTAKGRARP